MREEQRRTMFTHWQPASIGLAGLGWLASAWLLLRMAAIGAAGVGVRIQASAVPPCRGCDDVLMSSAAFALGTPLPAIGLVYFAALGCLLVVGQPWAARMALLLSAAGAGAGIVVSTGTMAPTLGACLPWSAVLAINLALLVAVLADLPGKGSPRAWAGMAMVVITLSAAVTVTAGRPGARASESVAEHAARPVFAIPSEPSDRLLGPGTGPARLVVFSSFPCAWCRDFAETIARLRARFGDDLTIAFKHFPLGQDCNPALASPGQPGACAAAWAAEAAALQGRFWRYQGMLFASGQAGSEEVMRSTAVAAGLDVKRWEEDRASPAVRANVDRDVHLGLRLGVEGTPAVFLDGRRLQDLDLIVLATLIREQVREARRRSAGGR